MTTLGFRNGGILIGGQLHDEASIGVAGGVIVETVPTAAATAAIDLAGGYLLPGFIDTQVNGGGGVLFNDDPSVAAICTIAYAHRAFGTTGLLPTLISDDFAKIEQALNACDAAIDAGVEGVLGVHIEGPFLSEKRRGIHRADMIRSFDAVAMALLTAPRKGVVMVTVAPDQVTPDEIVALVKAGVKVSVGHTDADYVTAMRAFEAGATGVTHLFNAMSPFSHRAPGAVGAALDFPGLWCGLIADGLHVHPAGMRLAARCLPKSRLMLVTDSMPSIGSPNQEFYLQGQRIRLVDARLVDDRGTLAGSHLTMNEAVRNVVDFRVADVATAGMMATTNPASFLGLDHRIGEIKAGRAADFVWLDRSFKPVQVWQAGQACFPTASSLS